MISSVLIWGLSTVDKPLILEPVTIYHNPAILPVDLILIGSLGGVMVLANGFNEISTRF